MTSSDEATSSGSEYQVFLSFRGPDTREGFTDVLFHSLNDAGICVFRDDEELRVGERIDGSLQRAIDNSRIYIPIFSQRYASSQWCLCELTQIWANTSKSKANKEILPIFFDVKPDDVKLKIALYGDAILSLQREKELSNEQLDAWRKALKEVGAVKGWEVKTYKGHGELIKLITEEVLEKLKTKHRLVTEYLVGIDDQVEALSKWLDIELDDVRFIQIHGMGGIGKTTLAKVIFNHFSSHFGKRSCFLDDVRAKSSGTDGLVELQKKLVAEVGHPAGTRSIDEIGYGMMRIGEVLRTKKVLIVLDDVDNSEQVEKLLGKGTLGPGSRILITTRNKSVLQIHRQKYEILDYEMEVMSTNHALELFSKHAFNNNCPLDDYDDISREIVFATGGLPLALEVIGSFLYNKRQKIWQETLEKLSKAPHKDVFEKLKISYDALTWEQQQIYLDIACFFIGEDKTNPIYMWKACEFYADTEVDVLINLSLVKIVNDNYFWMHDQLKDLGRDIVRRENPTNPGKRSRLWIHEEILDAITTKEMKSDVRALDLDLYKSDLKKIIESNEIGRFDHLRYLRLSFGSFHGNLANCLTQLRWISWSKPPPMSEPTNMHLKNAVILEFSDHDFKDQSKLSSVIKMARRLKVLSLRRCGYIYNTPNFSGCPNLERLTFESCYPLTKIDDSIGKLKCLTSLIICGANSINYLPEEIGDLVNLEYFYVQCYKVRKLPNSIWKLNSLREVHFFHNGLYGLDSTNSWELPSAIGELRKLEVLEVCNGSLKGQLPHEIGSLPFLRILELRGTRVSEVPKTISMLPRLERLELWMCHEIQELPALPSSLTSLRVWSKLLRAVPDLSNLTNLVELDLNDSGGEGDKLSTGDLRWIEKLSKLNKLGLRLRNARAPAELDSLPVLNKLHLIGLDLQTFPQLPSSLQELHLDDFNSIVSLTQSLRNLSHLGLVESPMQEFELDGLQLPNIRELHVDKCGALKRFTLSSMRKLESVEVSGCSGLVEIRFSWLESLHTLCIQHCQSFEKLVDVGEAGYDNNESSNKLIWGEGILILPPRVLNKLRSFTLGYCRKILEIHIDGTSESLEQFSLSGCDYVQSIGDFSNLKNLKSLSSRFCPRLRVVKGLDELEFLDELEVIGCVSLERLIDVSSTKLPNHCYIDVFGCREKFRGILEFYKHHKEQENNLGRDFELEQKIYFEQEQEGDFEQVQESDFECDFQQQQEQEGYFQLEQEFNQRRRLRHFLFGLLTITLLFCFFCFFGGLRKFIDLRPDRTHECM